MNGCWRVRVSYGFLDRPDVTKALGLCAGAGLRDRLALVLDLGYLQKVGEVFQTVLASVRYNRLGNLGRDPPHGGQGAFVG